MKHTTMLGHLKPLPEHQPNQCTHVKHRVCILQHFCAYGPPEITCRINPQLVYRVLVSVCNCVCLCSLWMVPAHPSAGTEILYDAACRHSRNWHDKCVCSNETEQIFNLNCCCCAAAFVDEYTVYSILRREQAPRRALDINQIFDILVQRAPACQSERECVCMCVSVWVNRISS